MESLQIQNDTANHRFFAELPGGNKALLEYNMPQPDTIEFTHTFVSESYRKRGVATELVKQALEYAQDEGYRVIPTCPFVANYIDQHSQYESLTEVR